jgi:hypothetical protein
MIKNLFERLDYWRHFPNYHLERRADIFFSFYIKEIIELKTENMLNEIVIPEFPLRRKLFDTNLTDNKTINVDFFLSDQKNKNVYFVELKTDMNSRNPTQDNNMEELSKFNFNDILKDTVYLYKNIKKDHEKYIFILKCLHEQGYIKNYQILEKFITEPNSVLFYQQPKDFVARNEPSLYVFYVQPMNLENADNIIGYDFILNKLQIKPEDELGKNFLNYLEKWKFSPKADYRNYL